MTKYELKRGELIKIDVQGQDVIVLMLTARRAKYHKMPSVEVYEEYGDFTSTIMSVTLTSTDEDTEGTTLDTYEIAADWSPGTDLSGSRIAVTYPDTGDVAKAELYMLY